MVVLQTVLNLAILPRTPVLGKVSPFPFSINWFYLLFRDCITDIDLLLATFNRDLVPKAVAPLAQLLLQPPQLQILVQLARVAGLAMMTMVMTPATVELLHLQ